MRKSLEISWIRRTLVSRTACKGYHRTLNIAELVEALWCVLEEKVKCEDKAISRMEMMRWIYKVSKSCKNSTWWATNSTIYMGTTSTMTMRMVLMRLIRAIFTQDMAACWAHNPVSSTHSIIHLVRWEVSWHSARVTFKTLKISLLKVYKVSIEEFYLAKVINWS